MDDDARYDALIESLYACPLAPDRWREAVDAMGRWVGAGAFHLFAWDQQSGAARLSLVSDESFVSAIQKFDAYYGRIDVVRARALSVAPGEFFVTQDHFDDRFVARNEWFQDFLIPQGLCWSTGGTVPVEDGVHAVLALLRNNDRGRYEAADLAKARRVWPHFKRAMSLYVQMDALRHGVAIGEGGLDRIESGVIATDFRGRVFHANRQAESICSGSASLKIRHGKLTATTPEAETTLAAALSAAGTEGRAETFGADPDTAGVPRLMVACAPLRDRPQSWTLTSRASVLVLLRERGRQRVLTGRQLVQLFGLSPAEARLARALAQGLAVEEHASAAGVAVSTVRTQLRRVLEKTGTKRQTELVKLLGSVPAVR